MKRRVRGDVDLRELILFATRSWLLFLLGKVCRSDTRPKTRQKSGGGSGWRIHERKELLGEDHCARAGNGGIMRTGDGSNRDRCGQRGRVSYASEDVLDKEGGQRIVWARFESSASAGMRGYESRRR